MTRPASIQESIVRLAALFQQRLDELYRSSAPLASGSALDLVGLVDGSQIVEDYVNHNELGLAFEHLIYMVVDPGIEVTQVQFEEIATVGGQLGLKDSIWQRVRVSRPA